ncbi:hypothetical protein Sango_0867800 [Sesamum angolense]|uniref:MULE transposase domain-containing protein n=1 Tax=Sesamum angolense TaxID=2727404 RepID=A0AAE1X445_9LAMI|nr:hypothetical protein Sango_0867800 [Sesamum angolense]
MSSSNAPPSMLGDKDAFLDFWKSEDVSKVLLKIFRKNLFLSWEKLVKLQIWRNDVNIYVEEEEAEPLQAIDSQGNPIEKKQEEEIRFLLEGIDFEELGGNEIEGDGRKDCEGQGLRGLSLRVMGDKTMRGRGKRKLYERFLNESSSEFDDSSDEDYVQSGEGSDSETPSLVLEDIECDSDDDIFLLKDQGVLRDWCIRNGVDLEFLRNEAARVTAKCKSCEWRIHASPIQGGPTFQIKTIKVYGGQLLVAVGRDGNDNMFPIAMAVVQVENRDTWGWFVGELLDDIGGMGTNKWSFISDRQKAIGSKRARLDDYVDDCYTKSVYLKVYDEMIHAVPGAQDYIKTNFQPFKPPKIKKKRGRPKKLRRKGPNELQSKTSQEKG